MVEKLNKRYIAILPEYIDQKGDCTILYSLNEEPLILERNIRTVLQNIGKELLLDVKEAKKRYGQLVSSPNLVPIPFSKDDIFVPLKTRIPLCKNDRAFGYINLRYIKDVKYNNDTESTFIRLSNGKSIECLCSLATVEKQLKSGRVVREFFINSTNRVAEDETLYEDGRIIVKVVVQAK